MIDYDFIIAQIEQDRALLNIQELAFDRWGSQTIVNRLQDIGFTVDPNERIYSNRPLLIQFGQGYASMSPPMRDLEAVIMSRAIDPGHNPVLTWHASNVIAMTDPAGNIKPDKRKSKERIDGIVALIMAFDRASRHTDRRAYEGRGLRVL